MPVWKRDTGRFIKIIKKSMKSVLKDTGRQMIDFLMFNRAELRGINILCLILLALLTVQFLIPETIKTDPIDFKPFEKEVKSFEMQWKQAEENYRKTHINKNNHGKYTTYFPMNDTGRGTIKVLKKSLILDLNTADTFDLQQLRGIGPSFAKRIVNYRERIRGFSRKDQLLEVFGMDSARFSWIRDHVTVTLDSIHPFDINNVTFKELLRHPYFPFVLTKQIMIYRQKKKAFRNLDELRSIEGVNDSIFRRISIYLRILP